jgi:hypothetical protein
MAAGNGNWPLWFDPVHGDAFAFGVDARALEDELDWSELPQHPGNICSLVGWCKSMLLFELVVPSVLYRIP